MTCTDPNDPRIAAAKYRNDHPDRITVLIEELTNAASHFDDQPTPDNAIVDILAHFILMAENLYDSPFDCAEALLARLEHDGYEIRQKQ